MLLLWCFFHRLLSSIKPALVKKINRLPTPIAGLVSPSCFLFPSFTLPPSRFQQLFLIRLKRFTVSVVIGWSSEVELYNLCVCDAMIWEKSKKKKKKSVIMSFTFRIVLSCWVWDKKNFVTRSGNCKPNPPDVHHAAHFCPDCPVNRQTQAHLQKPSHDSICKIK